ncbi:MAG: NAD(P)/FAD-dependent oxidoreductase [Proteobacteria bacterium]|nr:NAD(P)/FAD-dependent oxidoreductase [Pseudomonadota bacterium]
MTRNRNGRPSDRELGMHRAITRRDFVQGAAVGSAGLLAAGWLPGCGPRDATAPLAAQDRPGYYPPSLTGMRGSHPGSFENAHALRDGTLKTEPVELREQYDLVVVGAGISGLSAAHFYLGANPKARILLLDNHDDFGGHAKRNEFDLGGQLRLLNGGTLLIDSPRPYSAVADGVLKAIGIDAPALAKVIQQQDPDFYKFQESSRSAIFFDRETFGADHLAVGFHHKPWAEFLHGAPLSDAAKRDIERIEAGSEDYLPGLSSLQKKQRLLKMSYRDFLRDHAKVDPQVLALYQARTQGEWGVGIDAVSALDCWGLGAPGMAGLKLDPGSIPGMGFTPAGYADTGGSTRLHFPDGNATIARGLVRRLIPAAVPGSTVEDLVTARADYARLDRADQPVRLRLSSTVVRVLNDGAPDQARGARVTYIRDGRALTVRARHCVLACYNMIIPYLAPELPARQKQALHELVKAPLVYTSVAIRNARAFDKLGVKFIYAPGGYHTTARLNATVDIGAYKSPRSPDEPTLVWMTKTPCKPGLSEHDQNRAGRAELLVTPFEVFERNIREQLGRMLGAGGFDPASDITAITVNRWPHGYAPEHNSLWEPELPEAETPQVVGRARFGRIAIANSDSGGGAYTDVAIDQAYRAVNELLGDASGA